MVLSSRCFNRYNKVPKDLKMSKNKKEVVALNLEEVMELVDGCGNLALCNYPSLETLPEGISISGMLLIRKCPKLVEIPFTTMAIDGGRFSQMETLVMIPPNISPGGWVQVNKCPKITSLKDVTGGRLSVLNCNSLKDIRNIQGTYDVLGCPQYVA